MRGCAPPARAAPSRRAPEIVAAVTTDRNLVNDAVSGALVVALGVAAYMHAGSFPSSPGEPGPALFPRLAAIGLVVVGLVLVAGGLRRLASETWVRWPEWWRQPRPVAAVATIVAGLALSSGYMEALGFFVCAPLLVFLLMVLLRVRVWIALVVTVLAVAAVHSIFYTGLRVALPWGLFESLAW